jgi:hypothetical protein
MGGGEGGYAWKQQHGGCYTKARRCMYLFNPLPWHSLRLNPHGTPNLGYSIDLGVKVKHDME